MKIAEMMGGLGAEMSGAFKNNIEDGEVVEVIDLSRLKVGILHHDLEHAEEEIARVLKLKGIKVEMYDVRHTSVDELSKNNLVLNRVYASVANRDYQSIEKTLQLLKELEDRGVNCTNSYRTSLFDYSKYEAFVTMKKRGLPTPETILLKTIDNLENALESAIKTLKLPIIIKRNIGGRGKDVHRAKNHKEALHTLKEKFENAVKEGYFGGFILQEFIKSTRDHDCRLGVVNGNVEFSYSRSLISSNSKDKWLASTSNGSVEGPYKAGDEEKRIGIETSKLIGSDFNELDIVFTNKGPVVIESNPTPNYFDCDDDNRRIEAFVNKIRNCIVR